MTHTAACFLHRRRRLPAWVSGGQAITDAQKQLNWLQAHARARAEQANALLKMTFKALRRISLDPRQSGKIVAAALALLHVEHNRAT